MVPDPVKITASSSPALQLFLMISLASCLAIYKDHLWSKPTKRVPTDLKSVVWREVTEVVG